MRTAACEPRTGKERRSECRDRESAPCLEPATSGLGHRSFAVREPLCWQLDKLEHLGPSAKDLKYIDGFTGNVGLLEAKLDVGH